MGVFFWVIRWQRRFRSNHHGIHLALEMRGGFLLLKDPKASDFAKSKDVKFMVQFKNTMTKSWSIGDKLSPTMIIP